MTKLISNNPDLTDDNYYHQPNHPELFLEYLIKTNFLRQISTEEIYFTGSEKKLEEEQVLVESEVVHFWSKTSKNEQIDLTTFLKVFILPTCCIAILFFQPNIAFAADKLKQKITTTDKSFTKAFKASLSKNVANIIEDVAIVPTQKIEEGTKKVGRSLINKVKKSVNKKWITNVNKTNSNNLPSLATIIKTKENFLLVPVPFLAETLPKYSLNQFNQLNNPGISKLSKSIFVIPAAYVLIEGCTYLTDININNIRDIKGSQIRGGGFFGGLAGNLGGLPGAALGLGMQAFKIATKVADATKKTNNDSQSTGWNWTANSADNANNNKQNQNFFNQLGGSLGVLGSISGVSIPSFLLLWYFLDVINKNQTNRNRKDWVPNFPLPIPLIRLREKNFGEKASEFMYSMVDFNSPVIYVILFTAILIWFFSYGKTNPFIETIKFSFRMFDELLNVYKGQTSWFQTEVKKKEEEARIAQEELKREAKINLKKAHDDLASCNIRVDNAKDDCLKTTENYNTVTSSLQYCQADMAESKTREAMMVKAMDLIEKELRNKGVFLEDSTALRDLAFSKLATDDFKKTSQKAYREYFYQTKKAYPVSVITKSWLTKVWEKITNTGDDQYTKITGRTLVHGSSPLFEYLFGTNPTKINHTTDITDITKINQTQLDQLDQLHQLNQSIQYFYGQKETSETRDNGETGDNGQTNKDDTCAINHFQND